MSPRVLARIFLLALLAGTSNAVAAELSATAPTHAVKPEAIVSDRMPKRRFVCMILSPYKERELLRLFYSRLILLLFASSNVRLGKFAVSQRESSRRPPAASGQKFAMAVDAERRFL